MKVIGDRNKILSVKEYLNKIRAYLKDIVNNLKKYDTWEIQLTIAINFIPSKDNDEERVMHPKSDNIDIMINNKEDEFIDDLFQSLLSLYQIRLKTSMRGCDFIFNCVHLLYYKCHKIYFKQSKSYINSYNWMKTKKQQ